MPTYKAVVFDWAGTVIDFGSRGPVYALIDVFGSFGIKLSVQEARAPMGSSKHDHIKTILQAPRIGEQWLAKYGRRPSERDIDDIHAAYVSTSSAAIAHHADLVPGAKEAVDELRAMGLKIGSTTGYTRSIMDKLLPLAAKQGYAPDNLVCSDDVAEGRPSPLGMYRCFAELAVYPPKSIIKVDDTAPGIGEGIAAGCLAVGVTLSGNTVGLTPQELSAKSGQELEDLRTTAHKHLADAGAAFVIDTVADLPNLIRRLSADPAGGLQQ